MDKYTVKGKGTDELRAFSHAKIPFSRLFICYRLFFLHEIDNRARFGKRTHFGIGDVDVRRVHCIPL